MESSPASNGLPRIEHVPTPAGIVQVGAGFLPEQIRRFRFDDQFGTHAQYKSIYTKRSTLESIAGKKDASVALALSPQQRIVGFAVLDLPDPRDRWAALGPGMMMEVKAVEVSRNWRANGLARHLLRHLLAHERIEEMIAYMVGYSWTWDLDGSRLNPLRYRRMLIDLFAPFGFVEMQTNEPNICLKPENLFMARVGSRVPEPVQRRFKWLRFGLEAD